MAYADRKNTMSKKDITTLSKWANQPRREGEAAISQRQRDLWDALNQYVTERGAAIVSVKYANPVRLEISLDSPLADKLRDLGHDVIYKSEETRIGAPISEPGRWGRPRNLNNGYSFRSVAVYELRLPK